MYRGALLLDVSPTRSASCSRISGRLTERAKLNPQTPGSGRERFQIKARHPKCCSKAWISRLRPEGSFIKAHEFGPRGAELVKAGVGGRASGVRNRTKTPVPDDKRAAATNRDISAGFGAGASVRPRARVPPASRPLLQTPASLYRPPDSLCAVGATPRPHPIPSTDSPRRRRERRDNLVTKGEEDGSVGARRRRHELAHHDRVRVLGEFRVDFFEAEFAVEVVGRLVVADAR